MDVEVGKVNDDLQTIGLEFMVVSELITLNTFGITVHCLFIITHFMPLLSFYTPRKYQKTRGFLMLSESIERDQWYEMGECFRKNFDIVGFFKWLIKVLEKCVNLVQINSKYINHLVHGLPFVNLIQLESFQLTIVFCCSEKEREDCIEGRNQNNRNTDGDRINGDVITEIPRVFLIVKSYLSKEDKIILAQMWGDCFKIGILSVSEFFKQYYLIRICEENWFSLLLNFEFDICKIVGNLKV